VFYLKKLKKFHDITSQKKLKLCYYDNLAKQSRDHCQNHKSQTTLYIEYCKKPFLSPDFCNFWAPFDSFNVSDSCHV